MTKENTFSDKPVINTVGTRCNGTDVGAAGDCAAAPVLVIRGESTKEKPLVLNEAPIDGEKHYIVPGRNQNAELIRVPVFNPKKDKHNAHVDWLAFTFKKTEKTNVELLLQDLPLVFGISTKKHKILNRGWEGYKDTIQIGEYGYIAYGGKSQKNTIHVELNANACAIISNWDSVQTWLEEHRCKITRTDLAYDDFEGVTVNMEKCLQWYEDGLFQGAGRHPKPKFINDFDTGAGKTLYIGKRENGKLARMYEKGKQLGDPDSPWFRIEVELRSKSRIIPLDIITKPGQYLAATYRPFNFISKIQNKIDVVIKGSNMSYLQMVDWLKSTGGKAINAMLQVENGDIESVISQIVRDGIPKRLEPFDDIKKHIRKDDEDVES